MRIRINKIRIGVVIVVGLILLIYTGSKFTNQIPKSNLLDIGIPKNTSVIIHASTFTGTGEIGIFPRSELHFFNNQGELVKSAYEPEEVVGDFIMESPKGICYFFKNNSILTSSSSKINMEGSSGVKIKTTKFGPSSIGYIGDLDLSYALFNVGKKSDDISYINVLRFVSQNETYDVTIPYYLDDVHYDAEQQKFICMIAPVSINNVENGGLLNYVIVDYDNLTKKFVYHEEVKHLVNNFISSDTECLNSSCMVKNERLYNVMVIPEDIGNPHGTGKMLLSVYDLKTSKHISDTMLIEEYELGPYGGMKTGLADFPMIERCKKLYVFASTNQVFVITDEDNIEILDMFYVFDDKLPLSSPNYLNYVDPKDFTESIVHVEDDGEIYILSLFRDNYLRIHKLLNGGDYELVWEGAFSFKLTRDMIINDFEILSYPAL